MTSPDSPDRPLLSWETRIKLLTNGQLWSTLLMVFGLSSALLGVLVGFITKNPLYGAAAPAIGIGGFIAVYLPIALVIDLIGGFAVVFVLSEQGARSLSGKLAKNLTGAAVLTSLLAGKSGAMGAALMAESEQNVFIPWSAVTKVTVKPGRRYVELKREWGFKPIGLYCTRENYEQVLETVRGFVGDKIR